MSTELPVNNIVVRDAARAAEATSDQSVAARAPAALRIDILTTFPEMFDEHPGCVLGTSIPARARQVACVSHLDRHAFDGYPVNRGGTARARPN